MGYQALYVYKCYIYIYICYVYIYITPCSARYISIYNTHTHTHTHTHTYTYIKEKGDHAAVTREPPPKRAFSMLSSCPYTRRGAATSHQTWEWFADWVPQPRAAVYTGKSAPSRLCGGRRGTKRVIARGDGYPYISRLRGNGSLQRPTKRGNSSTAILLLPLSDLQICGTRRNVRNTSVTVAIAITVE
jgi:hypothetical protein